MTDTASLISDVDDTIRYWRNTGVSVTEVGALFRCHRSWPAVRERMIDIALADDEPIREAA